MDEQGDPRDTSELLFYFVKQALKQDLDVVWCHFWRLLHNPESLSYAMDSRTRFISLILEETLNYPDWQFIITADHGVCLDNVPVIGAGQRGLCRASLNVPLMISGKEEVV